MSTRRTLDFSRRSLLLSAFPVAFSPLLGRASAPENPPPASFPGQDPAVVKEMVVVSHGQIARVKELVARQQTLAKAAYDWGFGDWESAIDAASHVGNRVIAEFLLANGARPTIFSAAMLGHLDAVKACIAASPGIQKIKGLGSYEFYPVGAEHVRIRFDASSAGVTLTVHETGVVLTAKKTA